MPTYEYQCFQCGLQFEAIVPRSKRTEDRECPSCLAPAKSMVPSTVSGSFKKEVDGPKPQNTGIHDLDTHIDRVIGQHASQSYGEIERRVTAKKKVMAAEGVSGDMLSRNEDGSYRALSPEEKAIHDRSQAIHGAAMDFKARRRRAPSPR